MKFINSIKRQLLITTIMLFHSVMLIAAFLLIIVTLHLE